MRKVSRNGKIKGLINNNQIRGYCLKADIKHYFQNINHNILLSILEKKIIDKKVIWLIQKIVANSETQREREINIISIKGMPLGNLTSQFFANIYLNELDQFVKHNLRAKYYLRYVDDFVILHKSKEQLKNWKMQIEQFLREKLNLELHPQKSKILPLSRGIDFVGFRNFYNFKLLRLRNIRKMTKKIKIFEGNKMSFSQLASSYQGWQAYAKWANTKSLRKDVKIKITRALLKSL